MGYGRLIRSAFRLADVDVELPAARKVAAARNKLLQLAYYFSDNRIQFQQINSGANLLSRPFPSRLFLLPLNLDGSAIIHLHGRARTWLPRSDPWVGQRD
jgi:hypothetical protein